MAAGEPLNPEIIETWKRGTGLTLRDGYGQTESTCMVANLPGDPLKYGSMGRPTFLYDIVIADEEGNELPANEEGNITVRTNTGKPNGLFTDYFGDPGNKGEIFKRMDRKGNMNITFRGISAMPLNQADYDRRDSQ